MKSNPPRRMRDLLFDFAFVWAPGQSLCDCQAIDAPSDDLPVKSERRSTADPLEQQHFAFFPQPL